MARDLSLIGGWRRLAKKKTGGETLQERTGRQSSTWGKRSTKEEPGPRLKSSGSRPAVKGVWGPRERPGKPEKSSLKRSVLLQARRNSINTGVC